VASALHAILVMNRMQVKRLGQPCGEAVDLAAAGPVAVELSETSVTFGPW